MNRLCKRACEVVEGKAAILRYVPFMNWGRRRQIATFSSHITKLVISNYNLRFLLCQEASYVIWYQG